MEEKLLQIFAPLPKTTRGRPIVISGDPKGKNFLYTNGGFVIIRDIENPAICDVYTDHAKEAVVAKYSPSGFYIASGDVSGKVRIWDTTQKEHILKVEHHPISGIVKDLAWSPDNTKICAAGEARSSFAKVFHWDSGTSVGDLNCHSKSVNSIDYRPKRPFRIVTGSEDFAVGFYAGPPFVLKANIKDHSNFVNTVRYSTNGEIFATGGADCKIFLYNGDNGEQVGQLGEKAHKGGIYAMSFNKDGTKLLSVSGDKTAKIWDVESRSVVSEFVMGSAVDDMQVGCLWQDNYLLTVSLSGFINYLDVNNPSKPLRVVKGHNKSITALALSKDRTIFTGSFDSHINYMDAETCTDDDMKGKGHSNQVTDMVINEDTMVSISIDDTLRFTSVLERAYGPSSIKLESQPRAVDSCGNISIVASINHLTVFEGERQTSCMKTDYEGLSVALHPQLTEVAVGDAKDKLHIYDISNGTLNERLKIDMPGGIADLKYSPDGSMLATAGLDRTVRLFQLPNYPIMIDSQAHSARVNSVAWTPDSRHFATASIDSRIGIWIPEGCRPPKNKLFKAHQSSQLNRVAWLDNNTLVSVAQDAMIKQWKITY